MEDLLGLNEHDLLWYQMMLRAVIVFFVALIFIRVSGMRSFGSSSAFDVVVSITLGGLLGRCITGHYPFFPTLAASFTIIVCHQVVAYLSFHFKWMQKGTEGEPVCLFEKGKRQVKNMRRYAVNETDLERALHESSLDDFSEVKSIWYEVDGKISIVKKNA
jgi:uncharacterized membrane protein YcaP (DUF421 family)